MAAPIQHVFVLMLENRSFDHLLGFSKIGGTDARTGQPTDVDGLTSASFNIGPSGDVVAASTPAAFVLDLDPPHEFTAVQEQLCGAGGSYPAIDNSGFVTSYSRVAANVETPLRCFAPEQLPVIHALAREFAVCDRWFSSMPGPTWPNRFFIHAASSAGLDDSPGRSEVLTSSLLAGYRFDNGTIYDRLDHTHLDWRIYHGDEFPQSLAIRGMNARFILGRFSELSNFEREVSDESFAPTYAFIEPSYGHVLTHLGDFRCGNSQHPLDDVTRGERLLKHVYEAIRNSPHWDHSVLIVTYDEHGGFYDHVAPPRTVPPGDAITDAEHDHHHFAFDQLGVRVPALIISPLIPRNVVDHTVYDHSSVPATLEALFGLAPLTERDKQAATFSHLFSLADPRQDAPTSLPEPADSGFTGCDGPVVDELTAFGESELVAGSEQVTGTLSGFLRIALLRHLNLAADAEREQIIARYLAALTRTAARDFILTVKGILRR